ncbi:2-dehydropantoate 2-reductase [Noviherbaspirillum saxi]|uniref:2-dehydropantoate 2-reductase n=1 Tax=Noviherbaspirillum saxi TaxID=2320863 RepID=A0A3A3FP65_9BURK|nr:2-dehydropantoate 2-reductase [Noviherbaspirillum saxi]RJF98007.1 2-dehydropantoate 2-reductase [Noviherbaspirillum saxi]
MKIAVFGAGSIGVFVGASLSATGADVVLIGRASMGARIARHGVTLTDLHEWEARLHPSSLTYCEDPSALADGELVLVTVKSADTQAAAQAIRAHAKPSVLVLSLQNGIGNADLLRKELPGVAVIGGMVPFNVVQMPESRFHRGTEGELMVEASPSLSRWHADFAAARLPLMEREDFLAVQWGKLLLNLNNPVNALSDLPLKAELSQRAYRRCLALLIDEALAVLKAAGIKPAKLGRVAPHLLPTVLRLPDFLFLRLAAAMLRIDPEARSSMWEDLKAGRKTEIDYLNGAVIRLGQAQGLDTPANERMVALVHVAEKRGDCRLDGASLLAALSNGGQALTPAS